MINHIRTLLLNESPFDGDTLPPGEEFIDPGFTPYEVPTVYRTLYQAFMPTNGRDRKNFIAYQWLNVLHSPDFSKFVTVPDSRITYLRGTKSVEDFPDTTGDVDFAVAFQNIKSEVTRLNASNTDNLFLGKGTYAAQMTELRDIWNNGTSNFDRMAAALTALLYRFDDRRIRRAA